MATAYVQWGFSGDCDWGVTPLDERNYSCALGDGIHDLGRMPFGCKECGAEVDVCAECDSLKCPCSDAKLG